MNIQREEKLYGKSNRALQPAAVYAELRAYPGTTAEFVDRFLSDTQIAVDWVSDDALWHLVADRFSTYAARRRKLSSHAKRLLADFLVGRMLRFMRIS